MIVVIPFRDLSSFSEDVELDNEIYRFSFDWNTSGKFWSMSIKNTDNDILISGVKMVLNYDMIGDWCDRGLPDGKLVVIDESESEHEIREKDFVNDRRLQLIYLSNYEHVI